MKGLVVYYSRNGSNRYLAGKIAEKTGFEQEEIRPRMKALFPLIMASLTKIGPGNKKITRDISDYDRIILCGPIWMGQLIHPLRSFLVRYKEEINSLDFITCCGGGEDQKDSKFGYEMVFKRVGEFLGSRFGKGYAMPVQMLVNPGDGQDAVMKTRLSRENFHLLEERFNQAVGAILSS